MLEFNGHHGLECLYRFPYGIVEEPVDYVKRLPTQNDAFPFCLMVQTLAQNIVFGYDLGDIEAYSPTKQPMLCRDGVGLVVFISC